MGTKKKKTIPQLPDEMLDMKVISISVSDIDIMEISSFMLGRHWAFKKTNHAQIANHYMQQYKMLYNLLSSENKKNLRDMKKYISNPENMKTVIKKATSYSKALQKDAENFLKKKIKSKASIYLPSN